MVRSASWDRKRVLEGVVRRSSLPVALVDLVRLRVVTGSSSAADAVGQPDLESVDFLGLLAESHEAAAALELLRSGAVDGYEAHRVFVGSNGEERAITVWVRGLARRGFGDWALALVRASEEPHGPWDGSTSWMEDWPPVAVATADIDGGVDLLSSEIEALLGITTSSFRAESLQSWVHPTDSGLFATALERSRDSGAPEVVTVRLRTGEGEWAPVRIVLKVGSPTHDSRVGVAILGEERERGAGESNVGVLAAELRAIDLVDALTYLPASSAIPDLVEDLTEREWEIVARLLRGDRVPAIAGALFLAPSTVRNHLMSVFRKAGVNSQQELISRFRGTLEK